MVLTGAIDESFIAKSGIAAEVNLMKQQGCKMVVFEVEEIVFELLSKNKLFNKVYFFLNYYFTFSSSHQLPTRPYQVCLCDRRL